MPNVVLRYEYIKAVDAKKKNHNYSGYFEYTANKEKTVGQKSENEFAGYFDYCSRQYKREKIDTFTKDKDFLSKEEYIALQKQANEAQKNGITLRREFISFDNYYLERCHVYDSKSNSLNEAKMRLAIRKMAKVLFQKSDLNEHKTNWSANIHRDTNNIHVHFTFFETERIEHEYETLPPSCIEAQKRAIVQSLEIDYRLISETTDFLRKTLRTKTKVRLKERLLEEQFIKLIMHLPRDYKKFNDRRYKKEQEKLISLIKESLDEDDLAKLKTWRDVMTANTIERYGKGYKLRGEEFFEKKLHEEFYTPLGNQILKDRDQYIYEYKEQRDSLIDMWQQEARTYATSKSQNSQRSAQVQIVLPSQEEVDLSFYERLGLNDDQLKQVRLGFSQGLSQSEVNCYARKDFDQFQMNQVRYGFKLGINAEAYALPELSWREMRTQRINAMEEREFQNNAAFNYKSESRKFRRRSRRRGSNILNHFRSAARKRLSEIRRMQVHYDYEEDLRLNHHVSID